MEKKDNFTFISNNCISAQVMEKFGMQYNNPFIGCLIQDDFEFLKLCKNFSFYIHENPVLGKPKKDSVWALQNKGSNGWLQGHNDEKPYPVIHIGDIELHFIHETDGSLTLEKYLRRVERFRTQNPTPIFLFSDAHFRLDLGQVEYNLFVDEYINIPRTVFLARPGRKDLNFLETWGDEKMYKLNNCIFIVNESWPDHTPTRSPINGCLDYKPWGICELFINVSSYVASISSK